MIKRYLKEAAGPRRAVRKSAVMVGLLAFGLSLIILASARTAECAQSKKKPGGADPKLSQEDREQVRRALAAVGQILVRSAGQNEAKGPVRRGSAVLVRADGIVATCYHVITDERSGKLFDEIFFDLADGASESSRSRRYRVEPLLASRDNDLALLAIKSDGAGNPVTSPTAFPVVELADSRKVKLLDSLVIIGFPASGLAGVTVNTGIVEGVDGLGNWIKTDARVIHGNSGGAAVNAQGRLIGIPTKVLVDKRSIDDDGDGLPDREREYGAVGFLRPSHFVAAMLAQVDTPDALRRKMAQSAGKDGFGDKSPERAMKIATPKKTTTPQPAAPNPPAAADALVSVRGVIKSIQSESPIAGARVGLVRLGASEVSADSLLAWGSANAEGEFELDKRVPPGRYTLTVRALGYEPYSLDLEIKQNGPPVVIRLRPSS